MENKWCGGRGPRAGETSLVLGKGIGFKQRLSVQIRHGTVTQVPCVCDSVELCRISSYFYLLVPSDPGACIFTLLTFEGNCEIPTWYLILLQPPYILPPTSDTLVCVSALNLAEILR